MAARTKKKAVGLMARLPAELHKRIEVCAKARGVSLNSEVIDRLERSFGLFGQMTLCLGDEWATVRLHGNELLIDVGQDSPPEGAVLEFTDGVETFKEHFGVKK